MFVWYKFDVRLASTHSAFGSFPGLLCWKLSYQHNSTRGVCSWFGWVFSSLKWVFIYSHQQAIGAFQQRWWQDIKQIVCNEVIIKHSPVVSHTDLSLWQKNNKYMHTHILFPGSIETDTSWHIPLWLVPPHILLSIIIKGEECTVYFSAGQ